MDIEPLDEIPLTGGNVNSGVVRIGDTVRRGLTAASPVIHEFLRHLEAEGFAGSPRFLGIDKQNREILSYVEGETGIPVSNWQSDEPLIAVATLLRQYHDAAANFLACTQADWCYSYPDPRRHEVVCHNDFAPYNFVYKDEVPIAIIDFDLAGPGPRLRDVAYAVYWMTPLSFNSADQIEYAEADLQNGSRRFRLFCETYGVAANGELLDMIAEVLAHMGSEKAMLDALGAETTAKLKADGHLAHWQQELAAFVENRARLPLR